MSEFQPDLTTVPSPAQIDDAWIALLVGAIIIFIVSLIAILILCLFWHRYKRRGPYPTEAYVLGNKPNSTRPMPIPIEPYHPPDNYETQVGRRLRKRRRTRSFRSVENGSVRSAG